MNPKIIKERERQHLREIQRMSNGRCDLFKTSLKIFNDIPYSNDDNPRHTLDVIRPDSKNKLPVILEVHGGGFVACEKDINRLHSRYYAQKGFCVVNTDYTLFPEGNFSAILNEISMSAAWIKENADMYDFDTDRFFISGDSAGAFIILLYCFVQENPELQRLFNVTMPGIKVKKAAATCPVVNIASDDSCAPDKGMNNLISMMYCESQPEQSPQYLDLVSLSGRYILPPVFLLTTPSDSLLNKDALKLEHALQSSGHDYVFSSYVEQENTLRHVFNVLFPEWKESIAANNDILDFFKK